MPFAVVIHEDIALFVAAAGYMIEGAIILNAERTRHETVIS